MPPLALLAGGLATRMRPLTETLPKSMLTVAGEPFIAHQLRYLASQGVRKVVICAGHMWEKISDFAGDGGRFGLAVEYSLDGDVLLGTGGALKKALPRLGPEFMVMYGDSWLPTPFARVIAYFRGSQRLALMTVHCNQGLWDDSNIEFRGGEIVKYDKRHPTPAMNYIDYGLGVFHAEAFAAYPDNERLDLAGVYRDLLSRGQLAGYEVTERFYEIGSPQGLRDTDAFLRKTARA